MENELLRLHDVKKMIGVSRSFIYDAMKNQKFPKPIKLGARAVAWRRQDISAWIESRV